MGVKWTVDQEKAIVDRNHNIIVAAAAGSGKTAVLVERIIELILGANGEEPCSIDEMLVVTFTNAAASEMKEKIERAIKKQIEESDDPKTIARFKRQLELLPNANISTFHTFTLDVIHRFFYVINLEPSLRTAEEAQTDILKKKAIDAVFEKHFGENSSEFKAFLNNHSKISSDGLNALKYNISGSLYNLMCAIPDAEKWLKSTEVLAGQSFEQFRDPYNNIAGQELNILAKVFANAEKVVANCLEKIDGKIKWAEALGLPDAVKYLSDVRAQVEKIEGPIKDRGFETTRSALSEIKFPAKKKCGSCDEYTEDVLKDMLGAFKDEISSAIKDKNKGLSGKYFYDSLENIYNDFHSTEPHVRMLATLLREFKAEYDALKTSAGVMDFNDMEHNAYKILCADPNVCDYYRRKFKHVFVDEYQDTNGIQEALIEKVVGENNLFVVGDIKQSIYGFRLAEPRIFKERYEKYKELARSDSDNTNSIKIDLNANFRSKEPVVDFVNMVFESMMEGYDEDAKLKAKDISIAGDAQKYEPKLYMLQGAFDEEGLTKLGDSKSTMSENLQEYKQAEREALATVKVIRDYLGKDFFDGKATDGDKQGKLRKIDYRDIVVLLRTSRNYSEIFYKILSENGIPTYISDSAGFIDTIEINLMRAFLSIIDNEKRDVDMLTVMRSEAFNFEIDELIEVRLLSKTSDYRSAVVNYAENGEIAELREKCASFLKTLEKYRNLAKIVPLEDLITSVMMETGLYIAMGALPNGAQRQGNMRALVDRAMKFRKDQTGDLYEFLQYVNSIKKEKVSLGQVKLAGENDNTVKIMTIHASKGLEFPVVILPQMGKDINRKGGSEYYHSDYGFALKYSDYERSIHKKTILQTLISDAKTEEYIEEEKRILYVAMTRARDVLALIATVKDVEKACANIKASQYSEGSYLGMISAVGRKLDGHIETIKDAALMNVLNVTRDSSAKLVDRINQSGLNASEDTLKRMSYHYENGMETKAKSKYSVSDINAEHYNEISRKYEESEGQGLEIELPKPESFKKEKDFTAAEVGTIVHSVLEKLDFKRADAEGEDYVTSLLESMVLEELLTEKEAEQVEKVKIVSFARSELGRRIQKSDRVYREKSFNLRTKQKVSVGTESEEVEVIVQGIIDCFFVEDGKVILIDYKTTSKTNENAIRETYKVQMDLYKEAIREALGMDVSEAYLYLTNFGKAIKM